MEVTVIKGATIVHPWGRELADIEIKDGIISSTGNIKTKDGCNVIDATGMYIFAGAIDPHVHLHLPTPAGYSADDFESGSKAALAGGTTTIIDFVTPSRNQRLTDALEQRIIEASGCLTDYTFHVSPVAWSETTPAEISQCMQHFGISSFKIYMAYLKTIGIDDHTILKVLHHVAENKGLVAVHCENGQAIDFLSDIFAQSGKLSPYYHPHSRPAMVEAEAVNRILMYSQITKCRLYLVHISTQMALQHIARALEEGIDVKAETCPHYLVLDESAYSMQGNDAARYVLSPPLRKPSDSEALWQAISQDVISTIGTDHCPFHFNGQKSVGFDDFRKIPNGAGGIEHRLELLYTYGVLTGRISFEKMCELVSYHPAVIFGLDHRKGSVAVGKDADLVIWNPGTERVISFKTHFSKCDYSVYEGIKTKGRVETTIKSGKIIYSACEGFKKCSTGKMIVAK